MIDPQRVLEQFEDFCYSHPHVANWWRHTTMRRDVERWERDKARWFGTLRGEWVEDVRTGEYGMGLA